MHPLLHVSVFVVTLVLGWVAWPAAAADPFRDRVAPLLAEKCGRCH